MWNFKIWHKFCSKNEIKDKGWQIPCMFVNFVSDICFWCLFLMFVNFVSDICFWCLLILFLIFCLSSSSLLVSLSRLFKIAFIHNSKSFYINILTQCDVWWNPLIEGRKMMITMMNCFCGMVDWRMACSLISGLDHYQRLSSLQISNLNLDWTVVQ